MATVCPSKSRIGSKHMAPQHHSECTALDLSKSNRRDNVKSGDSVSIDDGDRFYFSNMLRSMVPRRQDTSAVVWQPLFTNVQWPSVATWPSPLSILHYAQSSRMCNRDEKPVVTQNEASRPLNVTHCHPKRKREARSNLKANNRFRLHQSSAFRTPSTSSIVVVPRRQQRNTNPINVRYVMNNLGKIFAYLGTKVTTDNRNMGHSISPLTSSEDAIEQTQREMPEPPPCKRFSALIGLEIVVDYVKHNE